MDDEMLILLHDDGEIDDEEYLVLFEANRHRNLHGGLPYYKYEPFNLDDMHEDECEMEFRLNRRIFTGSLLHSTYRKSSGAQMEWLLTLLKPYVYA